MSVVYSVDHWDPCDLQWVASSTVTNAVGVWALTWSSTEGGDLIAWSITTADGSNTSITITAQGNPVINGMGATDGVIYSPANLPSLSPNQLIAATGTAGAATTVFFNILIKRRSHSK